MKNTPKPTLEFNNLIAEFDHLMSKIALIVMTRVNKLNPIEGDIKTLNKFLDNNKNLKKTHGNQKLKNIFSKNIRGKNPFFGGFSDERADEVLERYSSIVKKRNMIVHSLPCVINGKYAKKYFDFNKENIIIDEIIIDEDFLQRFNKEAEDFIQIMENPDYAPIINEFIRGLLPIFEAASETAKKTAQCLYWPLIANIKQDSYWPLTSNIKVPTEPILNVAREIVSTDAIYSQARQITGILKACDMYQSQNFHPFKNTDNIKTDTKPEDNNSTQK